jgi:DNA mismatch endonuclease, patch repair protein
MPRLQCRNLHALHHSAISRSPVIKEGQLTDKLTPARRSWNMSRIRSKGMKPERIVRSLAHKMGYRFRLHRADLPGKPDLVFPSRKKAIFVHGCFWHQHESRQCLDGRPPHSNQEYWLAKLKRNKERDAEVISNLKTLGWESLVIWECETKDTRSISTKLTEFLDAQDGRLIG